MVMPAIAVRTYKLFKEESSFRKLIKQMTKKISKISDPLKRARFVHQKVEKEISEQMKNPDVAKFVSCKRGCTACCHTQVAVTSDEAILLAKLVRDGTSIDWTRMFIQAEADNSTEDFFKLSYDQRSCIFLGDNGDCQVYEDRPSVCRTNYVVSDPEKCKVTANQSSSVQLLNTYSADSWVYAQFSTSPVNGTLPKMVKEALSNFSSIDTGKSNDL